MSELIVLEVQEWFQNLIDDCKTSIVERHFRAGMEIIECWHEVGSRLLKENHNFERCKIYGEKIATRVSESLGVSSKTIERSIQFAKSFPDLDLALEKFGKNVSWRKICLELLPGTSEANGTDQSPDGKKTFELDKTGFPIPNEVYEDWNTADFEGKEILIKARELKCLIEKAVKEESLIFREVSNSTIADVKNVCNALAQIIPHAICPTCQGHNRKKCTVCKQRGFVSKFFYDRAIPEETKLIRQQSLKSIKA